MDPESRANGLRQFLCVLVIVASSCSATSPVKVKPLQADQNAVVLDKLDPWLRERYDMWRDHHGPRDRVAAEATVKRWECHDASYDERRGVSRCADMPAPTDEEYSQLEAARLVLEPRVD